MSQEQDARWTEGVGSCCACGFEICCPCTCFQAVELEEPDVSQAILGTFRLEVRAEKEALPLDSFRFEVRAVPPLPEGVSIRLVGEG